MKITFRKLSGIKIPTWTFPLALLGIGLLVYGLMLPRLGFYWDDWAKISVPRLFGPGGYQAYYAEDRPLSAWTHLVFNALLGETPLAWQLFQFILVLGTTFSLYWIIRSLWPHAHWQAAATALIFLVHPAFLQHAPAVTFHQQWLQYWLILLSFLCTLQGLRRPCWFLPLTGLAVLFSAIQFSVTEYFVPLELLRPLLVWMVLSQGDAAPGWRAGLRRAGQALARTAPSLALLAAYIVYRMFFIQLSGDDPYKAETLYNLLTSPLATLQNLGIVAVQDSAFVLLSAWVRYLVTGAAEDLTRFSALAIGGGILAGGFAMLYLLLLQAPKVEASQRERWQREAALIGAAAFLLGVLPAWVTGREVVFDFHSDRYALPALAGASLLMVAVTDWLAGSRGKAILLFGLLIGVGAEAQLLSSKSYADIWSQQRDFYWQLYWRAPFISPGTALVTLTEQFPNQGLFSTSAALNLLYPQKQNRDYLAYWWYALSPRYTLENLPDPLAIHFQSRFRNMSFQGSSRRAVVVVQQPYKTNCLWVVSADDSDEAVLDPLLAEASPMTDLHLIKPIAPVENWQPPTSLFGPEPEHGWCYYFEKGDLQAQLQNWPEAAALGDAARGEGYSPQSESADAPREWQPFIRAYAQVGRWNEAGDLTLQAYQVQPEDRKALCNLWDTISTATPFSSAKSAALKQLDQALDCQILNTLR